MLCHTSSEQLSSYRGLALTQRSDRHIKYSTGASERELFVSLRHQERRVCDERARLCLWESPRKDHPSTRICGGSDRRRMISDASELVKRWRREGMTANVWLVLDLVDLRSSATRYQQQKKCSRGRECLRYEPENKEYSVFECRNICLDDSGCNWLVG